MLKRPSGLTTSVPASTDWREFSPQTINDQRCSARTWEDGCGGQCTRLALNDTLKLCASHKVESERPLGLTHGFVTGAIAARKLAEFKSVRAFAKLRGLNGRVDQRPLWLERPQWRPTVTSHQPTRQLAIEMDMCVLCNVGAKRQLFPVVGQASASKVGSLFEGNISNKSQTKLPKMLLEACSNKWVTLRHCSAHCGVHCLASSEIWMDFVQQVSVYTSGNFHTKTWMQWMSHIVSSISAATYIIKGKPSYRHRQ